MSRPKKNPLPAFSGSMLIAALFAMSYSGLSNAADVAALELDELLKREVTSVSRRPERLSNTASSVFVISADEIRRSGVQSIPEALRLAPGVDAVRSSANRWSVSIRGFNDRFSNKLLVLIDGRNAYHPAFSGVFWESLLLPLADIERIEVIRGPGAVVWGSNAVNGVINIISKSSVATSGVQVTAGGGDRHGAKAHIRYGGQLEDSRVHYRTYAAGQRAESFQRPDGSDAYDEFENVTIGGRADGYLSDGGRWNLSTEFVDVNSDDETFVPAPQPPFFAVLAGEQRSKGFNLRARLENNSALGNYETQFSYARTETEIPALGSDRRDTFDLDAQLEPELDGDHRVTLGGGVRVTSDKVGNGPQQNFQKAEESLATSNIYAQDDWQFSQDLAATLGVRLEYNRFSDLEVMPSLRLRWNFSPRRMLWANVSRAARTPSRAERTFAFIASYQQPPGAPQSFPVVIQGSENFDTEYVLASEIGYRQQLSSRASIDLTLFHHDYQDLRTFAFSGTNPNVQLENNGELQIYGAELSASWRPISRLKIGAAYAWNDVSGQENEDLEASRVVSSIANIRAGYELSTKLTADVSAYFKSDRDGDPGSGSSAIDSFVSTSVSLRWQARPWLSLSLAGYDLFDEGHIESDSLTPARSAIEVPRGIYGEIQFQF